MLPQESLLSLLMFLIKVPVTFKKLSLKVLQFPVDYSL